LRTFTGIIVDLFDIQTKDIVIEDIAHALSQLCRFNGHTLRHYSVAQHSVIVSRLVPANIALEGLMHDAEEAYTGDMQTDLKHSGRIHEFCNLGDLIQLRIFDRFGLDNSSEVHHKIKESDTLLCEFEKESLFKFATSNVIEPLSAVDAEKEFLARFTELFRLRHAA